MLKESRINAVAEQMIFFLMHLMMQLDIQIRVNRDRKNRDK
jgi:hypothetical protein